MPMCFIQPPRWTLCLCPTRLISLGARTCFEWRSCRARASLLSPTRNTPYRTTSLPSARMKFQLFFLLLLVLAAPFVRGDGIPVDHRTGRVKVPHSVLRLTESQSEEIETLGTLTLLPEQWQQMRALGPSCPKRFDAVVPVTSRDPAPESAAYVIQLSSVEVALVHSVIADPVTPGFASELADLSRDISLYADRRGQFYYLGVLIPFSRLIQSMSASSGKWPTETNPPSPGRMPPPQFERQRELGVELPIGLSRHSTTLKSRLDKLFQAAKAAGWRTPDDYNDA